MIFIIYRGKPQISENYTQHIVIRVTLFLLFFVTSHTPHSSNCIVYYSKPQSLVYCLYQMTLLIMGCDFDTILIHNKQRHAPSLPKDEVLVDILGLESRMCRGHRNFLTKQEQSHVILFLMVEPVNKSYRYICNKYK